MLAFPFLQIMWYWWYNNYLVFLQTNKRRSNYLIFIGAAKQCSSPAGFLGEAKKLENLMDLIWHVLPACPPAQLILKSFSFSSLSPYLSRANPNSITLFSSSSSLLNELKPNMFNFPTNQMKRFKLFKLLILSDDDGASNMLTRLRFMSVCSLNRKGKKKSALCLVGWLVGWMPKVSGLHYAFNSILRESSNCPLHPEQNLSNYSYRLFACSLVNANTFISW